MKTDLQYIELADEHCGALFPKSAIEQDCRPGGLATQLQLYVRQLQRRCAAAAQRAAAAAAALPYSKYDSESEPATPNPMSCHC